MLVQDNEQVTKVGWFCGILEGEGYFKVSEKKIIINNTDVGIIDACKRFLKSNYVYFTDHEVKWKNYKLQYYITIPNNKTDSVQWCNRLYELIKNNLECRRNQFEQLLGTSETICDLSVDLDWLAGIYEAEGSFSLIFDYRNQAAFEIQIANTNLIIIDKIARNLVNIYCAYHFSERNGKKDHHKKLWYIRIRGFKRCNRFLYKMKGRWMSPRNIKRTSLMSEFIDLRLRQDLRDPYSDRQRQIVQAMRDLNR